MQQICESDIYTRSRNITCLKHDADELVIECALKMKSGSAGENLRKLKTTTLNFEIFICLLN